jgi:hypothetical protein
MVGAVFMIPVLALKLMEKRSCAVVVVASVPQLYNVDFAFLGPKVK